MGDLDNVENYEHKKMTEVVELNHTIASSAELKDVSSMPCVVLTAHGKRVFAFRRTAKR